MMQNQEKITALPGIFATIAAGFDLTARHLWLLLLPILLDIFLWLGPRLSFQKLIEEMVALWPQELVQDTVLADMAAQLLDVAPHTNLFTTLSVRLLGVPVLLVGLAPLETPLPTRVIEISEWAVWFGYFAILTVGGLLLSAVYYSLIAHAIKTPEGANGRILPSGWGKQIIESWARFIGLALVFLLSLFLIYVPLLLVSMVASLINPMLGVLALFMGPFLLIWVVIYMSLSPEGIVYNGRSLKQALSESFRLVHTYLLQTVSLLLLLYLIALAMDWLFMLVESGSWFMAVNILAHAFVSTALVASLFIFYRDRHAVLFPMT